MPVHTRSRAVRRDLWRRFDDRRRIWRVAIERVLETERSVLALGRRGDLPVVLKVLESGCDEWHAGEILDAFGGRGAVRVYEYVGGAMLLERVRPATPLGNLSLNGEDEEATLILAETIAAMSPRIPAVAVPKVSDWGKGFERYWASMDAQIPEHLVSSAQRMYSHLSESQMAVRLLHGDLHHANVVFDHERGWLAFDPKGVVGEPAYEVGAALRNPCDRPELYATPVIIEKRVERFSSNLHLDATRVLSWAFAQAILAAIWAVEDGSRIEPRNGWIALADAIRPMLNGL